MTPKLLYRLAAIPAAFLVLNGVDLPAAQAESCAACHFDRTSLTQTISAVAARKVHVDSTEYRHSVHRGECATCHPGFDDAPQGRHQTRGSVIGCGSCHQSEEIDWLASIHGRLSHQGDPNAPACVDCHGAHNVRKAASAESPVSRRNLPAKCSSCHEAGEIVAEYGLPRDRLATYTNSFHGLAVKFGKLTAADCASCHNTHLILPSTDPRSSIHKENLAATCGKCHPGAGSQFASGKIHVQATPESSPGMFYVRKFYTYFIGALMILFVGYIILEHSGYARSRRRKGEPK